MVQSLFEKLITLYILTYLENYNSAYKLIKTLSRKFGIFDFSRVVDDLIKNEYLTGTVEGQMDYYFLTSACEIVLSQHLNDIIDELRAKYLPNDPEYIKLIISRSGN